RIRHLLVARGRARRIGDEGLPRHGPLPPRGVPGVRSMRNDPRDARPEDTGARARPGRCAAGARRLRIRARLVPDMSDRTARAVRRAYSRSSWAVRLHLAGRWRTCPFPAVEEAVPRRGTILDAGCGHGLFTLYLERRSAERRLAGVDIDARKLPDAEA